MAIYSPVEVIENLMEGRPVHHITLASEDGTILTSFPSVFLTDLLRVAKGEMLVHQRVIKERV